MEVQTENLALTTTHLANGYVKAKTVDNTTDAVYQNWYSTVYLPTAEEESPAEPPMQSVSAAKTTATAK